MCELAEVLREIFVSKLGVAEPDALASEKRSFLGSRAYFAIFAKCANWLEF